MADARDLSLPASLALGRLVNCSELRFISLYNGNREPGSVSAADDTEAPPRKRGLGGLAHAGAHLFTCHRMLP